MKTKVTSVEALYNSREGTGEAVLDEMVSYLRKTRIISVADFATILDVSPYELEMMVRMLTGMTPRELINRWRLLQARELLHTPPFGTLPRTGRLTAVAHRCGWRNYRVLLNVARRYGFELEK